MENIIATETQLFETLREVFSNEKAERMVSAIKQMTHTEMANQTQVLATSKQLSALEGATSKQLSALEVATGKQISDLEVSTRNLISALETRFTALEMSTRNQISALEMSTRDQISALEMSTKDQITALETRLIDRFHRSQFQVVFWIVSIGVLQFIASYLLNG